MAQLLFEIGYGLSICAGVCLLRLDQRLEEFLFCFLADLVVGHCELFIWSSKGPWPVLETDWPLWLPKWPVYVCENSGRDTGEIWAIKSLDDERCSA